MRITMADDRNLIEFMEMCLVEREYVTMAEALARTRSTFSQYDHYSHLLEEKLIEERLNYCHYGGSRCDRGSDTPGG